MMDSWRRRCDETVDDFQREEAFVKGDSSRRAGEPALAGMDMMNTAHQEFRPSKFGLARSNSDSPHQDMDSPGRLWIRRSEYEFALEIMINEHGTDSQASGRL